MSSTKPTLDELLKLAADAPPLMDEKETAALLTEAIASGAVRAGTSSLRRRLLLLIPVIVLVTTALLLVLESQRETPSIPVKGDRPAAVSPDRAGPSDDQIVTNRPNVDRSRSREQAGSRHHRKSAPVSDSIATSSTGYRLIEEPELKVSGGIELQSRTDSSGPESITGEDAKKSSDRTGESGPDGSQPLPKAATAFESALPEPLHPVEKDGAQVTLALSASHFVFKWFNLSTEAPIHGVHPGLSLTAVVGSGLLPDANGANVTYMSFLFGLHGWQYFNGLRDDGWRVGLMFEYKYVPDRARDGYYRAGNGFRFLPAIGYKHMLTDHLVLDASGGVGSTWNFDRSDPVDPQTGTSRTVYHGHFYLAWDFALRLGWRF